MLAAAAETPVAEAAAEAPDARACAVESTAMTTNGKKGRRRRRRDEGAYSFVLFCFVLFIFILRRIGKNKA